MGQELRIFGPPGTGKTTYLAAQIARAVERYGNDKVLVASFTRAAAAEISSRGLGIPAHMVGTLHAHCYRLLGTPEIAETHIKEWNESAADIHVLSGDPDMDETIESNFRSQADEVAARYQTYRNMLRPRELWEADVRYFAEKWESWKQDHEYIDFTDMLEMTLADGPIAPHDPAIGFFDETQDNTPLELAVVRQWAQNMSFAVMAGDDDQCLYQFRGATADAFLDPPLPDRQKRVLTQSYRVPQAVHEISQRWVQQLSRREPKEYQPRDLAGNVRILEREYGQLGPLWSRPDSLLRDAQRYIDEGKSVMFLTSCAYMLDPLKYELRSGAVPFHNPYRRKNGGWNPLFVAKGIHSAQRLAAWMQISKALWTPYEIKLWSASLSKPKVFAKDGAKRVENLSSQHRPITPDLMAEIFTPEFVMGFQTDDYIGYFESLLLESRKKSFEYPLAVLRKHGVEKLAETPKIILGTIHSVKGGEADVVYLMPDLSRAGYAEYIGKGKDAIIRQMYVGMTRAKETLCITGPADQYAVRGMR